MKVLGINGSHRKGATLMLIEEAFKSLDGFEKEIISLSDYDLKYCRLCNACKTNGGVCAIEDGYNEIAEKMKESDAIIVGSPVYFGSVSAKLKTLFDRSRTLRVNWDLKGKVCGAISVGGVSYGGQEYVLHEIQSWALIQGMLVVADTNPTAHFGCASTSSEVDGRIEVDDWSKLTAKNLGKRISEVLERLK